MPTYYSLGVAISDSIAGTINPSVGYHYQIATSGSNVSVTATPNAGYLFDHWEISGGSSGGVFYDNPHSIFMNANYTIEGFFTVIIGGGHPQEPSSSSSTTSTSPYKDTQEERERERQYWKSDESQQSYLKRQAELKERDKKRLESS